MQSPVIEEMRKFPHTIPMFEMPRKFLYIIPQFRKPIKKTEEASQKGIKKSLCQEE